MAQALSSDPSTKLLIEGNCDERGTEEYNRSLGERRALAAREALAKLGVDPMRIVTRSLRQGQAGGPRPRRGRLVEKPPRRFRAAASQDRGCNFKLAWRSDALRAAHGDVRRTVKSKAAGNAAFFGALLLPEAGVGFEARQNL